VMELVEGPTLAERIAAGPLPLEEALPLARQMTDALELAHEKGVTHRDLKPANIKVTPQGAVKLLDFGLAKALDESPGPSSGQNSPTLSVAPTQAGMILGTAAYMSPEQARGTPVDQRADIWSFGVVLYEMLVGKQLFGGEMVSDSLAAVITKEPDWEALPADTPAVIRQLLVRCLRKPLKSRLQAIGEARIAIEEHLASPVAPSPSPPVAPSLSSPVAPSPLRSVPWALAGVLTVALAACLWAWWRDTRPVERPLMRLNVDLGPDIALASIGGANAILSPDGTRLAFVSQDGRGAQRLHIRRLDQPQSRPLPGTEEARNPFFSPDGQWVAFFSGNKLKKIPVEGGANVTLCDAGPVAPSGSWGEDGYIVANLGNRSDLFRVPPAGGTPEPVIKSNERENIQHWPQVLPGGKAVLFTAGSLGGGLNIDVQILATGRRKTLQRGGSNGRYLPSGHLVWVHQGALFAAPMNLDRLELAGPAVPVLEEVVSRSGHGGAQFDFSPAGTLVYLSGKGREDGVTIQWLDSAGKTQPLLAKQGSYYSPRLSPDGKRLAVAVRDGANEDIWVYDSERDTLSRLSFDPAPDGHPIWTPDGKHIVYRSGTHIAWAPADGSGRTQRLMEGKTIRRPHSFTPDGKRLAFLEAGPEGGIWTVPVEADSKNQLRAGKPEVFLGGPPIDAEALFSPDGKWLAYTSSESGTPEVYVRPFPGGATGGRWQISNGGGMFPRWSRNGRELFYRNVDSSRIWVAPYTVKGGALVAEKPRVWSQKRFTSIGPYPNLDLAPDGKRFAVLMAPDSTGAEKSLAQLTFLLNFFDELRRRAPLKR